MIAALFLVPVLGIFPSLQQADWVETRFYRVHLRNGNFIDGQILKDLPSMVVLKIKSGEMEIHRDQIDTIEFVKMRTINEPTVVQTRPGSKETSGAPLTEKPGKKSPGLDLSPAEIHARVDKIVQALKASKDEEKSFPVDQLRELGEEGAVYLTSHFPKMNDEILRLSIPAVASLKVPKTVPILVEFLKSPSPKLRQAAIMGLGYMGDGEKEQYVRPLLRDSDPRIRQTVLSILGSVQDASWFDPINPLCTDRDREVRTLAVAICTRLALKNDLVTVYLRTLADLADSTEADLRMDGVGALGAIGTTGKKEVGPILARRLNDTDPKIRAAAVMALTQVGASDVGGEIVAQIPREQDHATRVYLAAAVQRLRLTQGVEPLIDWLADPDEEIRKVASAALLNVTGQPFGMDREKWLEWFRKSGSK
jgi:hypothetical protein